MVTLRDRLLCAVAGLSLLAATLCGNALPTTAQPKAEAEPNIRGPGLFIFFEGDQPGKTIAFVFGKLLDNQELLRQAAMPFAYRTVQPRDSICQYLYELNYPLPCGPEILEIVERVNSKTSPVKKGLQIGEPVFLPDLSLKKYTVTRRLSAGYAGEIRASEIEKNWKTLNPQIRRNQEQIYVSYDAYRIYVATESEQAAAQILRLIDTETAAANIKVDFVPEGPTPGKQYSGPPETEQGWRKWCDNSTLSDKIWYRDMSVTAATNYKDPGVPPTSVPVHIIDGPVNQVPNLFGALANSVASAAGAVPSPEPKCTWIEFSKPDHHATHMAGIIASRDNGYGFVGIAPLARIVPFEWLKVEAKEAVASDPFRGPKLSQLIDWNNDQPAPIPVYLIATEFQQPPLDDKEKLDRFRYIVPTSMRRSAGIFVVAAGQTDKNRKVAKSLSAETDISPQNLGDLENVIVVTACTSCSDRDAKLLGDANYSSFVENPLAVHIAAPGGSAIGSWVADGQFAVANGTSQAAAFVAGVAAQMIGTYKDVYKEGYAVKKRLQATSYPARWNSDDERKLSAGIVDPKVAMLDPTKHWVKQNGKWDEIKLKPLSSGDLFEYRDANNTPAGLAAGALLRVVRTTNSDTAGDRRWDIYVDPSKLKPKIYNRGLLIRVRDQIPSGALALCGGGSISLANVEDLIVAFAAPSCP